MNVRNTEAKKKQKPAMKTISGRTYEQGGNLKRTEDMMTRDRVLNETIVLDALRRFMMISDLSDQRISRLMGVERMENLEEPGWQEAGRYTTKTIST